MKGILTAGAAGLLMCAVAAPAAAADAGSLIVIPARGTIDQPIDVVTSGLCTQGVTFVVAVRGEGIDPVTSGNAVGNTPLTTLEPAIYPGHHAVPLSRTLREYFVSNGVGAPQGEYDLVFACRNRLDLADLQTFTGSIRIKADSYAAVGDAAMSLEDLLAGPAAPASPDPASSTPAPAADSSATPAPEAGATEQTDEGATTPESSDIVDADSAGSPDSPGEGTGGGVEPATPADPAGRASDPGSIASTNPSPGVTTAASSSPVSQDSSWRIVLGAVGIVLLLGAGYAWWKSRKAAQ